MHTKLLNLGFVKKSEHTYVCEDITIEIRGDMIYVPIINKEVSVHELELLMLDY
jgi:hypothetical protein